MLCYGYQLTIRVFEIGRMQMVYSDTDPLFLDGMGITM